jgi:hypothetical protein
LRLLASLDYYAEEVETVFARVRPISKLVLQPWVIDKGSEGVAPARKSFAKAEVNLCSGELHPLMGIRRYFTV